MNTNRLFIAVAIMAMIVMTAAPVSATNGYFLHGIGAKSKGMAGAGVALPQSTLDAASNPATLPWVEDRGNVGLALFNPNRNYNISGNPSMQPGTFGLTPGKVTSGSKLFPIPHFGMNWQLENGGAFGVALYGQGGMNTDYNTATFYGTTPTGVNLSQMYLAITYAHKLNERNALSVTPTFAMQMFSMKGIQAFADFSEDETALTNNGTDKAFGAGVRFGYLGQWTDQFAFGASFATKTYMSKFEDYAGLFAEEGGFTVPANWTVGIAVKPSNKVTLAFDVQQILYEGIKSVSNPMSPAAFQQGILLGSDNGAGFGWENMTIAKFGLEIQANEIWALRGGYSYGNCPIPDSEMMFNILAPGVISQHLTFGASVGLPNGHGIDLATSFALTNSCKGPNAMDPAQTIEIEMNQVDVEIGYSF
jgi:long-chain fatty acid transport protein